MTDKKTRCYCGHVIGSHNFPEGLPSWCSECEASDSAQTTMDPYTCPGYRASESAVKE